MFERAIEDEGREVQRRLYAHHDYFGNIIPSTWFLIGVTTGAYIFYRDELRTSLTAISDFIKQFGEPSTGVDVLVAVVLAVAAFNLVYIIGQVLNGTAAVVLDRIIVKKLLQYPFTLYELKWQSRDAPKDDTQIFREAVLRATYGVFCVNLIPVVFFELVLVAFGRANPHAGSFVVRHPFVTWILALVLVIVHFGTPSLRKAQSVCRGTGKDDTQHIELIIGHLIVIAIASIILALALIAAGYTSLVLLLPLTNIAMAIGDRKMLQRYGETYKSESMRNVFVYARRTFVNPSYFAAKLVGYGSAPGADLLGRALEAAKYDSRSNDFYWMCQLRLENDAPRSYDTAYHGMAMYTMNRNLCNATAFIVLTSIGAFYAQWPVNVKYLALTWVVALCILTYMFFIRYLYLFSGLYSKYVVRAAAFLADRQSPHVITPP